MTKSFPAPVPSPSWEEPALDPAAALFGVMRATYWATGEELLQRLVGSLAGVLGRKVVLAEHVTPGASGHEGGLGLWIADPADAFRYAVVPGPEAPTRDDAAVVAAAARALGWDPPPRSLAVRSPSGRPLGQLLAGGTAGGRFGVTLLDSVLLAPLAARAGAELARLLPASARGPGCLVYMCAWCKGVRNPRHQWKPVEDFIRTLADAAFTHGICPECAKERV
jgi:hypothetical protein